MSRDGEWGTEIELPAIADVLGLTVLITNDSIDEEEFQVWIYPKEAKTSHVILLGFCVDHYHSLEGNNC